MTRKDYEYLGKYLGRGMRKIHEKDYAGYRLAIESVARALQKESELFNHNQFIDHIQRWVMSSH
jgi:hypothetical protein